MSDYPPDGYGLSVGEWVTDADRNTVLANLIDDSCVELKNTLVATAFRETDYTPLEGGGVYQPRFLVQADSVAGGDTVRLRTVLYDEDKGQVSAFDTHFAVLPGANTWYDMRSLFTATGTARFARLWVIKAATAFTVYIDYIGIHRRSVGFSAFESGPTALGAAGWTQIDLDSETYDHGVDFDSAAGYDFVAPYTGRFHFDGNVTIDNAVTDKQYRAAIYVNGVFAKGGPIREVYHSGAALDEGFPVSADLLLARGDSVELWAYNGSAGGLNTVNGAGETWLNGHGLEQF